MFWSREDGIAGIEAVLLFVIVGILTFFRWQYKWFLFYSLGLAILFLIINIIHPENFDKTLISNEVYMNTFRDAVIALGVERLVFVHEYSTDDFGFNKEVIVSGIEYMIDDAFKKEGFNIYIRTFR